MKKTVCLLIIVSMIFGIIPVYADVVEERHVKLVTICHNCGKSI